MKIAFIGGGNMGTAILSAVIQKNIAGAGDISVVDISEERLDYLKKEYGINITTDYKEAVTGKDVIIFSIKPQTVPEVLPDLKDSIKSDQLVLSIMAGIKIETLVDGLSHPSVIRVMPNTPAQVYEGMSVWTDTEDVTDEQREMSKAILGAIGKEIYVDEEKYMNMVTAVSGSGPAYFFRFVEALTEAGAETGLSRDLSYELVLQTLIGSGKLMRESGKSPAELREMVTSKGGTTAAALDVFEKGNFYDLVKDALLAAYNRGLELGGEK